MNIKYKRPYLPKYQSDIIDYKGRATVTEGTTKCGKAQPLSSKVYTPEGFKLMGDVKVGDVILTPTGKTEVIQIHPQGEQDVYRIKFNDGTFTHCTLDHLWKVVYPVGKKYLHQVLSTEELLNLKEYQFKRVRIPVSVANFDSRIVNIHPYIIGALIGDGSLRHHVGFTNPDKEIIEKIRKHLPGCYELKHRGKIEYAIVHRTNSNKNDVKKWLDDYGLMGKYSQEKEIPEDYIYNNLEVRKELLKGLIDTDGWVNYRGHLQYSTSSKVLADQVQFLITSIGGSATITSKIPKYTHKGEKRIGKRSYNVNIKYDNYHEIVSVPHKLNKIKAKKKPVNRILKEIEKVRREECQCISVADKDQLYLTDNLIATHNSVSHIFWLFEEALKGKDGHNYWWVAPVYAQAKIMYTRLKRFITDKSIFKANDSELKISLINGSVIWFKTAEKPDNLYGEDVYSVVLDEFTRMREDAWIAIRSTLTKTRGKLKFIGNVKGTGNWGFRLARQVEAGKLEGWKYFKVTAMDAVQAGILEQAEVDEAEAVLPKGVFLELYYGIPNENASDKFCYSFDKNKHIGSHEISSDHPLVLSFDFNFNPISCLVIQEIEGTIYVHEAIKLENSNIYNLCDVINIKYPHHHYLITGDATGQNRSALVKDNLNYYRIIREKLRLTDNQFRVPKTNPKMEQNQVLVNAILEHKPFKINPDKAQPLIYDCEFVRMDNEGKIVKTDRSDPTQQSDCLDCARYYLQAFHRNFINMPKI